MKKNKLATIISLLLLMSIPFTDAFMLDFDGSTLIGRKDHDGRKFFYHPDHLGSTDVVTNESANVVEETTYKPYGEVQSGGDSRFLFTSKELNKITEGNLI